VVGKKQDFGWFLVMLCVAALTVQYLYVVTADMIASSCSGIRERSVTRVEDKAIYEQLCSDFRSLNGFLWQTPLIVMTLTGGLWFSVANFELSETARRALLAFAGIADVLMVVALIRLRSVMERTQAEIRKYDGRPAMGPNYVIVSVFSILLGLAAIGSLMTLCNPGAYFLKQPVATVKASGR
jgi:hypothetical protein